MMTKMPRDLWKRIVESGFVAIVTVMSFLSFSFDDFWRQNQTSKDIKKCK